MTVIHWFRRDLRLADNPALAAATARADRVLPVYVASNWRGSHRWTGTPRQTFLCGCLESLAKNLATRSGRLIVRRGDPVNELERLLVETGADGIFFNRDPDPHGRRTEEAVAEMAGRLGRRAEGFADAVLHGPGEILTANGSAFRVFTPYSRAWLKTPKNLAPHRAGQLRTPPDIPSLPLPTPADWGLPPEPLLDLVPPGEAAARRRMERFLDGPILHYAKQRNIPAIAATSRLSQDLRFGLLSIRELYSRCDALLPGADPEGRRGVATFINELIWREFYMALLGHFPDVLDREFNPKFRGLAWRQDPGDLDRWKQGLTGFPIVDAAMRQLLLTGYMHNRTRMITAMFLTKDLLLDWRLGEQWFMQRLADGEIASNNGGWQWSAGTGADAAPYFRIQNPWTQTQTFDPDGAYIRTWVHELRDTPAERLLHPPPDRQPIAPGYPPPMVDHAAARQRALDFFRPGI